MWLAILLSSKSCCLGIPLNKTEQQERKLKLKKETGNRTNEDSVANDETNYAVKRKVSEVFNEISTYTQECLFS